VVLLENPANLWKHLTCCCLVTTTFHAWWTTDRVCTSSQFTEHLQPVATRNYSAVISSHTLQFTTARAECSHSLYLLPCSGNFSQLTTLLIAVSIFGQGQSHVPTPVSQSRWPAPSLPDRYDLVHVEVNSRLTVSRPVCLFVGLPSETRDHDFFLSHNCGVFKWDALSDERTCL
jgi:hypothetical protein